MSGKNTFSFSCCISPQAYYLQVTARHTINAFPVTELWLRRRANREREYVTRAFFQQYVALKGGNMDVTNVMKKAIERGRTLSGGVQRNTLFFFYKNIFYKNIEAEICEILRIF